MANRYWIGGSGTWNTTSTTNWATTSGSVTGGASVPTAADSVFFDTGSGGGGTFTVTMTGALACLDITVSTGGVVTFATGTTPTLSVASNMAIDSSTLWNSTGTVTFTATTAKTVLTNGAVINAPVTFNGTGGSWQLLSNFSVNSTSTVTLTAGTLNLNNFTLTTGLFSSASAVARTIAFDTGKIVTTSATTSTVWNTSTITNLTITGTPLVECQGGGTGVTKTISAGALAEANAISFSLLETTGTATYAFTAANTVNNLIVNGSQTISNIAILIYGSFTHTTTNGTTTFTAGVNAWTFAGTSGSDTITPAASFTYDFPWTFGSALSTATWTLAGNVTLGSTRTLTLTTGTLSLSTFTFTTGLFSSAGAVARTLNFGTGKIVLNSATTSTVWTTATVTGLTISGTPLVECQGGGAAVTKTINTGALSEANAISFSLLETTGTAIYAFTAANVVKNLITNGVQTVSNIAITIYGSFTHTTTNGTTTFTAGANAWTFGATSGTYSITNISGFTYGFPWTFGSATASTATWTLSNNLTMGATRVIVLTNGTFDVNNKTVTVAAGFTISTGSATLNNTGGTTLSITGIINHTSGTLTLGTNLTTTAATGYTLTAGTLSLGTKTLTVPVFVSNNANVRTLAFGTGQLALTGNAATIFDITTATSFSTTGTVYINCTYTGATGTRTIVTGFTQVQAVVGYNISTSGTNGIVLSPSATDIIALTGSFASVDFTGFTGTLSNTARTIYGFLIVPSSGGTYTAGTLTTTFASTGTLAGNITTNGRTLDFPFTFNGAGGTFTLQDNFTTGSTRTITLNAGTLNLNNFTLTAGFFSSSAAVARTLAFGSTGQFSLGGNGGTIFDVTTATNFTTTGTVYINCTYTGATGTRIFVTGFTEAQTVGYDIATSGITGIVLSPSATDIVALTGSFEDINLTGFTGTLSNTARTIYGSWTNPASGGTYTAGTLVTTFASTSSKTITTNARTLDFPFTFNGTSGTWALQDNFTTGATRTTTLTAGTLNLNNFVLSTGFFSSISAVARTLAFGTGQLTIVGSNATIFDVSTATNFATTGTVYINCTYASSVGTRTITTGFTEAQASAGYSIATSGTSGIVLSPSATDIVVLSGSFFSVNLTGFTGTLSNIARTIYGSWTNPASGGTYTAGVNATTFASTSSQTITGNGRTIDFPITFNGVGGSWELQTAFTTGSTRTTTLTAGTLNLNNYTYTTQIFSSSNANARTLAFGSSGQLALVGSGTTIFDITTATNYSTTGTVYINSTYALSVGTRTFVTGFTEVQADAGYSVATSGTTGIVLSPSATDIVALTGSYNNINLTGFIGTLSNTARTVYGNWTNPASGGTYTAGTNATSFRSTASQTITTNGRTLDFALTFDGVGGTWTLQDNLTIGATRILTWNNGTLDLNNFTLSNPASITISGGATGLFTVKNTGGTQLVTKAVAVTHTTGELNLFLDMTFAAYTFTAGTITLNSYTLTCTTFTSTSTTARTFAFGTGNITVTASGSCFNMLAATNHVVTGTPNVNITNSSATATSVVTGVVTEAQSLNFIFSGGAYALTFLATASHAARSITFSEGWAGTWAATSTGVIYGSLSLSTTMTLTISASAMTFGATSGTKTITTASKTIPFPLTFNGVGSTFQLIGALTTSAAVTLTNGTFDGNSQTISGVTAFTMVTGTATIQNVSTALAFTLTSGTLNLGSACSFGAYTFTAATLNLSSYTLTCTTWTSTSTTARTLAFGTGNITVTASGACFNMLAATNITVTGTPNVNITNATTTATSVVSGVLTEAQSMNFIFSGGAYTLTFLGTASHTANNVDMSSFIGTWAVTAACTIYGSMTLGSSMTLTESASIMTFGGAVANASKTINPAGKSILFPMTFSSSVSTYTLQNALVMGATAARALIITAGTFETNTNLISAGFAGSTMSVNTGTISILNLYTTLPFTLTSGTCTFGGSSCNFGSTFTFTAGTMTLGVNATITGVFTYTAGTINLSTYSLNLNTSYVASGATTRVINFGSGSYIQVNPTTTSTVWNAATIGTFSYTGTSDIRINGITLGNVYTISTGAATEAQAMNFTFTGDSYSLATTGSVFKNVYLSVYDDSVNFGTWTVGAITIYGNYTETGVAGYGDRYLRHATSASVITFAGASGSKTIDTRGIDFLQPVTFNGTASIWQLQNTFSSTGTNGTVTLTAGTLQLNGYSLYANIFNVSGSTARTIDFGTSTPGSGPAIVVKGNGTPFTAATATNLTLSGTYPWISVEPAAASGTITIAGSGTEAQSFNYWFYNDDSSVPYTLNFLGTAGYTAKDVKFNTDPPNAIRGFSGTWAATSTGTIYGSLSMAPVYAGTMTLTASASAMTFGGTSGTKSIETNGISIAFPITFNGAGSTFQLSDNLTLSTTTLTTTHTNGILNLNGKTLTTGTYATAVGTKNITFNAGILLITGSGATAFNNANPTGFTTTVGTGTGEISLNSATAKTFVGGSFTYNCALANDGAGALTITGSNSFLDINNGVVPTTFTFTAGTTQTVSAWNVNGTAGNLVVLNSSTAGTLANISKTGGGYMDYVSIKDLAFQPCSTDGSGALPMLWFAGANSTNLGNNFGISFDAYVANTKTYYISLASITTWTLPVDWNPISNFVHLIGGGGGGAGSRTSGGLGGGPGGGGGGYTRITNYSAGAGTVVSTTIGASGAGGAPNSSGSAGGSTVFGAYSAGGGGGGTYGTGGAAGAGSTYNGGRGGLGSNSSGVNGGGGGGGGAGGPNGAGGQGGDNFVTNGASTGGGGNGGGTNGSTTAGGNGWLGTGGGVGAVAGTLGTGGGGGPTGAFASGKAGGSGFDIYGFIGGGGGGGGNFGGTGGGPGGAGGNYGAGGAGAGLNAGANPATFNGGAGAQGLIVIRYVVSSYSAGSFFAFF
jgi:hypothetical protein